MRASDRPRAVLSFPGTLLCPMNVMRRHAALLLVLALGAPTLAGCNYDPETRLFRQVAPHPDDVALAPPGTATERNAPNQVQRALEACDEDRLRCHAQNLATELNALTFALLSIVDAIVQFPPSEREVGRRVWGPHFEAEQNATFRFEMVREDDGTFSWCLHAGRGDLRGRLEGMSCGVEEHASGMLLALSGLLTPGDTVGEAARSGSGSMVLEGPRLRELEPSAPSLGLITLVYDNTSGRDVTIEVEEADDPASSGIFGTGVTYQYMSEPDGSGTFFFAARANFVGGNGSFGFSPVLEDLVIRSRWDAAGAGRADGTVSGGDLDEGESYEATECWDSALETTFLENTYEGTRFGVMETDCVFQEPLPLP